MKKRILLALLALCQSPVYANSINATSNPVANSSGSVTNFAVQNLPSRQFTNQFGGGIVCQGSTLAIQPFLSSNLSFGRPRVDNFMEPIYSTKDLVGDTDDDGNPIGDGEPDSPGTVIGYKQVTRFEKDNYAISPGISISWNIPLDFKAQALCREAAAYQVSLLKTSYEDKRLSYELGRLKICSTLLSKGVRFKEGTKYAVLCDDVELTNPPGVLPNHKHSISYPGNATSDQ